MASILGRVAQPLGPHRQTQQSSILSAGSWDQTRSFREGVNALPARDADRMARSRFIHTRDDQPGLTGHHARPEESMLPMRSFAR